MKWVCVATAPNEPIAESWAHLLRQQGVPAYVKREAVMRVYLGPAAAPVPVMVPQDREADGKRILDELLSGGEGPPGD